LCGSADSIKLHGTEELNGHDSKKFIDLRTQQVTGKRYFHIRATAGQAQTVPIDDDDKSGAIFHKCSRLGYVARCSKFDEMK